MLTEIKLNGFASFKHETCLQTDKPINFVYGLNGAGKIAEFATDTIDTVQDTLFPVFEIGKDMLRPYLFTCSGIFPPEVVTDADMVLDRVVVEPLEPFVTDELPVCDQAFDAVTTKQADEPLHDIDSLLAVGVPAFGQEPEQDWERHMIIRYAQN